MKPRPPADSSYAAFVAGLKTRIQGARLSAARELEDRGVRQPAAAVRHRSLLRPSRDLRRKVWHFPKLLRQETSSITQARQQAVLGQGGSRLPHSTDCVPNSFPAYSSKLPSEFKGKLPTGKQLADALREELQRS